MDNGLQTIAVGTFLPMLESLAAILDKASAYAESAAVDLVNARLAPDMFTLAEQVREACYYAKDGAARLAGEPAVPREGTETTLSGLKSQIGRTVDYVRNIPAVAFDGAEKRDCSIELPNGMIIEMDGSRFLKAWLLPHFYFHLVTTYDILRHSGVEIGKMDYLSQVGGFIRAKTA